MKKKWFALTMVICLLIAMTGCSTKGQNSNAAGSTTGSTIVSTESTQPDNTTENEKPVTETTGSTTRVLEKTQWYEVTETAFLISYTLFDKDGKPVKNETDLSRLPRFVYKDGVVRVTLQAGTGILTQHGYFYDLQNNVFSEEFNCILDHKNGLVARADLVNGVFLIVIEDIFNDTQFYQEIPLVKVTSLLDPYRVGEFSEDGKSFFLTYYSNVDKAEITEEFALQSEGK